MTVLTGAMFIGACDEDADASTDVTFGDLRAEDIGPTRAMIRFTTSLPTTCEVEYGVDIDTLDRRAEDPSMNPDELSVDHEVPLEDLEPETTYYYRGYAVDADGRAFRSETLSFTTLESDLPTSENVGGAAAGATVTAVSSNFGGAANGARWGVDAAIDGQMSTEWASAGEGDDAWFELDLGTPRAIRTVGFRGRSMPDGSSIVESFRLVIDAETSVGPFDSPDPDTFYTFELPAAVAAISVRFEVLSSTGGNTGVRELQLFE